MTVVWGNPTDFTGLRGVNRGAFRVQGASMAKIPDLLQHSKKGYYFVRYTDPATKKRRDKTFGSDKAEANRLYKGWLLDYLKATGSTDSTPQPARPAVSKNSNSVSDLVVRYLKWRQPMMDPGSFKDHERAGTLLREMFGRLTVKEFGVPQFEQLIECMIGRGWALRTINVRIGVVKVIFRYALKHDEIDGNQFHRLDSGVDKIRSDDRRVKPAKKIPPVPVDVVERTLPYLTPMVRDIVQVQLLAGMRAAEACRMRFDELSWSDSGALRYRPVKHKNANRGKNRKITLGPKAQAILATYGVTPEVIESGELPREYVFDPRDTDRRKSEFSKPRFRKKAKPCFSSVRYTIEIKAGVDRAIATGAIMESERWKSNMLRHRALTDTRRDYGLDAAQVMGGHSDAKTTQRYAEPDDSEDERRAMETG